VCSGSGEVLTCTFILFYLVVKTTTTTVHTSQTNATALTVCKDTVAVYSDGMPLYTLIGKGCLVVELLGNEYTVLNGTVFFWQTPKKMYSTVAEEYVEVHSITLPMWIVPTLILIIRELASTKADL